MKKYFSPKICELNVFEKIVVKGQCPEYGVTDPGACFDPSLCNPYGAEPTTAGEGCAAGSYPTVTGPCDSGSCPQACGGGDSAPATGCTPGDDPGGGGICSSGEVSGGSQGCVNGPGSPGGCTCGIDT